jgi:preprotein translocase subunit SecG
MRLRLRQAALLVFVFFWTAILFGFFYHTAAPDGTEEEAQLRVRNYEEKLRGKERQKEKTKR